jgi:hypothetical protein
VAPVADGGDDLDWVRDQYDGIGTGVALGDEAIDGGLKAYCAVIIFANRF